jgi:phage shock protein A
MTPANVDHARLTAFALTITESADALAAEALRQTTEHAHALDGLRARVAELEEERDRLRDYLDAARATARGPA